ncbi:cupin domain-containing protein [Planctobacterium marinum]|uniref:cupin domain-containing protein n=1 Tax=Planctobacterium marinum TaxID=1631968 RepID=UPI00226D2DEB|nr:cupin domain-containing protein [Planctobacterium marinum]MCC2605120.1 cupin domain-containing protein [Planctobacterium marinum]
MCIFSQTIRQYLIVTQGEGWVQEWNGEKQLIKAGDVVWTPPHVKHWHGATESKSMSHYAIQNAIQGETVHWLEKVSE